MHEYPLLEILAIGFTLALLMGYLAKRLGLSSIVGYLVAGFLVGPHSFIFSADMNLALELAEAGVILLMFGVGLHFNLKDLSAVKGVSLPGALFQSSMATLCGFGVAEFCGLSAAEGLLMGMGLAVASTLVLLRVLSDNNMLDTVHGHVAVGWLVAEDILTVLILVLLPSLAVILEVGGDGSAAAAAGAAGAQWLPMLKAVGLALLRLSLLWVIVLVIGGRVVPWVLNQILRTRSQELFTLTVLVAAFATAFLAGRFLKVQGRTATLIGVGTAICGGSAIAATAPVVQAEEEEVAHAISTIFLFNVLAAFLFPFLGHLLGMGDFTFGLWAGTAVNDTSSVAAAGYSYSQAAGDLAVIVKLTRTLMIVPVTLFLAFYTSKKKAAGSPEQTYSLGKIFPWFVLGFLLASLLSTFLPLPQEIWGFLAQLGKYFIVMAMAAIGLNTNVVQLLRKGGRPVLLGLITWAVLSLASLGAIWLLF